MSIVGMVLVVGVLMSPMWGSAHAAAPDQIERETQDRDAWQALQHLQSERQSQDRHDRHDRNDRTDLADISVPEPASLILLGTGLIGLAHLRRRFR